MTRPSDIPQEAWVAASYVHLQVAEREAAKRLNHVDGVTVIARAIMSAVEEERDRQAKLTEAMADALYEKADAEGVDGRDSAFAAWVTQNIAAAIRQRKET